MGEELQTSAEAFSGGAINFAPIDISSSTPNVTPGQAAYPGVTGGVAAVTGTQSGGPNWTIIVSLIGIAISVILYLKGK